MNDDVQKRYARWMAWGMGLGFITLIASFAAYLVGMAPHVPIDHLPTLWQRPASELLARSGLEPGWSWAGLLPRSDMATLAAVAWLASCSIPCLLACVPVFFRRGEKVFVAICLLEVAVIVLAASGVLVGGH